MELRPYQKEAKEAIFEQWDSGVLKTLLVRSYWMWKDGSLCQSNRRVCSAGRPCSDPGTQRGAAGTGRR